MLFIANGVKPIFSVMDSDQERPVIRSTMPVLFLSKLPYQFSLYGLILLCSVLNGAHTTSLYNSITGSIIFRFPIPELTGYRYHQHDKQNEKQKFCRSTFRGYSFLNNVGTSLSFVAPQNFMPWRKSTRFVGTYSPPIFTCLFAQPAHDVPIYSPKSGD